MFGEQLLRGIFVYVYISFSIVSQTIGEQVFFVCYAHTYKHDKYIVK